jgi:hypothetical protein
MDSGVMRKRISPDEEMMALCSGNIVGLTLESKLGKMVDLREEVEG